MDVFLQKFSNLASGHPTQRQSEAGVRHARLAATTIVLQKRDGDMALPPVDDPSYVCLVREQIASSAAMEAWDAYLPKCLEAPDSLSIAIMELALSFHTKCVIKVLIPSPASHFLLSNLRYVSISCVESK